MRNFLMRTTVTFDPLLWRIAKGEFGSKLAKEVSVTALAEYYAALINTFGSIYFGNVNPRSGRYIRSSKALRALVSAYNLSGIVFGLVGQTGFDEFMLKLLDRGGVVRPSKTQLLAIPLTKEAKKLKSPRQVKDGFWIRTKDGDILFGRRALLNRRANATVRRFKMKREFIRRTAATRKPTRKATRRVAAQPRRGRVAKEIKISGAEERRRFVRTQWNPYQFSPMFFGARRITMPPKRFWRNSVEEFWNKATKIGQARLMHGVMKAMQKVGKELSKGGPRSATISLTYTGLVRRGGEIEGALKEIKLGYRALRAPKQHIEISKADIRKFADEIATMLRNERREITALAKLYQGAMLKGVLELRTKSGFKKLMEFKFGKPGAPRLLTPEELAVELERSAARLSEEMLASVGRAVEKLVAKYPKLRKYLYKDLQRMEELLLSATELALRPERLTYPRGEKYGLLRLTAQFQPLVGSLLDIRRRGATLARSIVVHGDWVLTKFLEPYVSQMMIAVPKFGVRPTRFEQASSEEFEKTVRAAARETWAMKDLDRSIAEVDTLKEGGGSPDDFLAQASQAIRRTRGRLASFRFRGYNIVRLKLPALISPQAIERDLRSMLRRLK